MIPIHFTPQTSGQQSGIPPEPVFQFSTEGNRPQVQAYSDKVEAMFFLKALIARWGSQNRLPSAFRPTRNPLYWEYGSSTAGCSQW